jgi:hypothetical protein
MGIGKYCLYGFGGFFAIGAIMMPFIPERSPEEDLAAGKRYFNSQCESVTRNRQINGRFGRGYAYCGCMENVLVDGIATGDEYRFAADMHTSAGTERVFFVESRMKFHMDLTRRQFEGRVAPDRMIDVTRFLFENAKACARSM